MKVYYLNDEDLIASALFQKFLTDNPASGMLKIRSFAASMAVPIKGLRVIVSSMLDDNTKVIFFEGVTDESGMIENIKLPAPKLSNDNLVAPVKTEYEIEANYDPDNIKLIYKINMYEDVCVMQNINITPTLKVGGFNGR